MGVIIPIVVMVNTFHKNTAEEKKGWGVCGNYEDDNDNIGDIVDTYDDKDEEDDDKGEDDGDKDQDENYEDGVSPI